MYSVSVFGHIVTCSKGCSVHVWGGSSYTFPTGALSPCYHHAGSDEKVWKVGLLGAGCSARGWVIIVGWLLNRRLGRRTQSLTSSGALNLQSNEQIQESSHQFSIWTGIYWTPSVNNLSAGDLNPSLVGSKINTLNRDASLCNKQLLCPVGHCIICRHKYGY